jgi:hypothetical protein
MANKFGMQSSFGDDIKLEKLKKVSLRNDSVLIGYQSGMPHANFNGTLDELAKKNSEDYGTKSRPFLKDGIKANLPELDKLIKTECLKLLKGSEPNYHKIGVTAVTAVQEFVRGDYYKTTKPNSPATIAKKSTKSGVKDRPLIDSSQMINGLTYTIERG